MTFLLRGRLSGQRPDEPPKLAIGEADAHVFNCPTCSRPLSDGTPKCPGCGTRLIMGVAVRRAVTLMGFGAIVGLFIGGMLTSVVIKSARGPGGDDGVRSADGVAKPVASAAAGPSAVPVATAIPVPPAAQSALRQAAILDARIAEDATALSRIAGSGTANDIAKVLRTLSADAAIGADLAPRIAAGRAARRSPATAPPSTPRSPPRRMRAWRDSSRIPRPTARTRSRCSRCSRDSRRSTRRHERSPRLADVELPPVDLGALAPSDRGARRRPRSARSCVARQLDIRLAVDRSSRPRLAGTTCEPSQ